MTHVEELRNAFVATSIGRDGQPKARAAGGLAQRWVNYLKRHRAEIVKELDDELKALLWRCSEARVELVVDEGALICSGPEDALTGDMGRQIEDCREGLVWALSPVEDDGPT